MPNLYTHISFGREVIDRLPEEVKAIVNAERGAYELGCLGPDFLFILRETGVGNVKDYALKMHYTRVYEAFDAITDYLKENGSPIKVAYALGLMCHYTLDSTLHPYVFETTSRYACAMLPEKAAGKAHHFIESAIDEYYITEKGVKDSHKIGASSKAKGEIGALYEQAVNPVFDEKLKTKDIKFAFFMAKLALKLSRDKTGCNRKFIRFAEKLFFKDEVKFSPLVRPPVGYGEVDYFNESNRPFGITRDGEETENVTVYELLERAMKKTEEYLPDFYEAIKSGIKMPPEKFDINYEGQKSLII